MIGAMDEQGVVKLSTSPWASPVVLVPKKGRTLRFCVDYRRLNAVAWKNVYPLPRVDDILDALGEARYVSSLNLLASGYWQMELDEAVREKSAFMTLKVSMSSSVCHLVYVMHLRHSMGHAGRLSMEELFHLPGRRVSGIKDF